MSTKTNIPGSNACCDPSNKWQVVTRHPLIGYGIYGYFSTYLDAHTVSQHLRERHFLDKRYVHIVAHEAPRHQVHPYIKESW